MPKHRISTVSFAHVYPYYVAKAEKKGRTRAYVDIIRWLTGYTQKGLSRTEERNRLCNILWEGAKVELKRKLITGVVCGVRVEDVKDKLMREIRYLDKLVDELAKGKTMEKILRKV